LISSGEFPLFEMSKNGFLLYPPTKIINAYMVFLVLKYLKGMRNFREAVKNSG